MSRFAACTIISKNYLSLARVWHDSIRRQHPEARTFVLIVDRIEDAFDPKAEPFEVVDIAELGIPRFNELAFKYNILELNTAVKPFLMEYLFAAKEVDRLIYLDPDVCVYGPLTGISDALAADDIVLIPHILSPLAEDGKRPSEIDFLISGSYNLGCIGLRSGENAKGFLSWWGKRLLDNCYSAPDRGLFTDQKWIDLVPSIFQRVKILKDPGYDVAYWNLQERMDLSIENGEYRLAGAPLVFFHFSGLQFDNPAAVSKYQNRFRLDDLNENYRRLFERYVEDLNRAGLQTTLKWRYAFGCFSDGVPIAPAFRSLFARHEKESVRWGDPFRTDRALSFRNWLLQPAALGSPIPRYLAEIYRTRPDLRAAIPSGETENAPLLLDWGILNLASAHGVDVSFVDHLRAIRSELPAPETAGRIPTDVLSAPAAPEEPGSRETFVGRLRHRLKAATLLRKELEARALYGKPPKSAAKQFIQNAIGVDFYRWLRLRIWLLRWWMTATSEPDPALIASLERRIRVQRLFETEEAPVSGSHPFGVNLFGYLDTESGVGEIARSMAMALRQAGIPHALINIGQPWLRREDRSFTEFAKSNPYSINLVMVNADQAPAVVSDFGEETFSGRINIGYWFWELSRFPAAYSPSFDLFDEIWVASTFCLDAMSAASPIRVVRVAPGFEFRSPGKRDRQSFGIEPDEFVFLYVFDGASSLHRKNPAGAIRAFRDAFPNGGRERLILKTTNATPRQIGALKRLAGASRVSLLTDYLDRDDLLDLIGSADAYVSLHRSEGFGLTLLESMAMGKPVIATDYSGNRDFLNGANGYPVPCRLVELRRDFGPYAKGNVWADPDLASATRFLREVRANPGQAAAKGARAREHVRATMSIEEAASRLILRLTLLTEGREAIQPPVEVRE